MIKTKNNFYYTIAVICFCSQIKSVTHGMMLGDFFPADVSGEKGTSTHLANKTGNTEPRNLHLSADAPPFFPDALHLENKNSESTAATQKNLPRYAVKLNARIGQVERLMLIMDEELFQQKHQVELLNKQIGEAQKLLTDTVEDGETLSSSIPEVSKTDIPKIGTLTEDDQLSILRSTASMQAMNTTVELSKHADKRIQDTEISRSLGKMAVLQEKYEYLFDLCQALTSYACAQCTEVEQLKQVVLQQNQQIAGLQKQVEELKLQSIH